MWSTSWCSWHMRQLTTVVTVTVKAQVGIVCLMLQYLLSWQHTWLLISPLPAQLIKFGQLWCRTVFMSQIGYDEIKHCTAFSITENKIHTALTPGIHIWYQSRIFTKIQKDHSIHIYKEIRKKYKILEIQFNSIYFQHK